ncbi:MAG: carboxypeptidase-like regulatory domain-containing protein [Candidatus Omnitrophota bacterium]
MRSYMVLPIVLAIVVIVVIAVIVFMPSSNFDGKRSGAAAPPGSEQAASKDLQPGQQEGADSTAAPTGVEKKGATAGESPSALGEGGIVSGANATKTPLASAPGASSGISSASGASPTAGAQASGNIPLIQAIGGVVNDTKGFPLYNVRVEAAGYPSIVTANDGRFKIDGVKEQTITLTASREGYQTLRMDGARTGSMQLTLVLVKNGSLAGRVIDQFNEPVSAARIAMKTLEGIWSVELNADPGGRFEVTNAPDKTIHIQASQEGYTDEGEGSKEIQPPFSQEAILQLKQPAFSISGRVVMRDSNQGVARFNLSAKQQDAGSDRKVLTAVTDGSGYYQFEDLIRGSYLVSSLAKENASLNVVIPVDEDFKSVRVYEWDAKNIDFKAVSGRTIRGTVVDQNNRPISGANVTIAKLESVSAVSGSDGRFTISGAPVLTEQSPNYITLQLYATHPDYGAGLSDPLPNESAGQQLSDITITLHGNASLQGSVVDQRSVGVADAAVILQDLIQSKILETRTDASGAFVFDKVSTSDKPIAMFRGTHSLTVAKQGYAQSNQEVVLSAGQQQSITVKLQSSGTIQGRITDNSGKPLAGVQAKALHSQGGTTTAVSDAYGQYILPSLADGAYDLLFRLESSPPLSGALYQVPAGSPNVDIVLTPGEWVLAGTVVNNETDQPLKTYLVTIAGQPDKAAGRWFYQTRTFNSPDGTYQVTLTEPGNYMLTFSAEGYQPQEMPQRIGPDTMTSQYLNPRLSPISSVGGLTGTFIPPEGMELAGIEVLGVQSYPVSGNTFTLENIPAGKQNLLFRVREGNALAPMYYGVLQTIVIENVITPLGQIRGLDVSRSSYRPN